MDSYVGEKLGNYRLARLLGSGGFAEVYLGEHMYLKTQAAIKVLRVNLDDQALAQFLTEARTIAHLEHPHIVRTLEFGVQDSTAYLVMSYAPNGTVLRRYPRGSVVPLHHIIEYVRQIADALQYAHAHELIHRDVKPENMLLGRDGGILLSDFGLAVLSPSSPSQGPVDKAGTITYMAPEQIEGKPDRSSDQYALGVVVYEWLCGRLPFTGLDQEIAIQHLQVPPPPLCKQAPSVPPAIEQVVMKALAKDPSQRFLSVLHFAQVLEEAYQPHKLVRLLGSGSHAQSVDARDTPFKHETHSIVEPEAFSSSPAVFAGNDDDPMMRSPRKMPTSQAAPKLSAQTPRRISRRVILAGLAGLTAVNVVSAGAIWSFRDLRFSASSSHGSSSRMQVSSASQATPGTTNPPASGLSTPPHTPGNPHATSMQNGGSTSSTSSAPTPQATSKAKTTSPSTYTSTTNTTSTSTYTSTTNTTSPSTYTPTATTPPTPQPQPTQPVNDQQGAQRQQNNQGQNDQGQKGQNNQEQKGQKQAQSDQ